MTERNEQQRAGVRVVEAEEDGAASAKRPRHFGRWIAAACWLAAVITLGIVSRREGLTPIEVVDDFGQAIRGNWWGPVAFMTAYAARPLIAFPGSLMTILGGVVFGPFWGTLWVIGGSNASTAVTYAAGRFVGGDTDPSPATGAQGSPSSRAARSQGSPSSRAARSQGSPSPRAAQNSPGLIRRQVERARNRPFVSTMVLRLLYLPFDPVGWVAGFVRLRFWPFLAGSAVGTLPGIVSFVGFGASIDAVGAEEPSLDMRLLAFSLALAVAGVLFSRWLGKRSDLADAAFDSDDAPDTRDPILP